MIKKLTFFTTLLSASVMSAQTILPPDIPQGSTSFVIVSDSITFNDCKDEITRFAAVLNDEGLPTFVYAGNWTSPEMVKDVLKSLRQQHNLEGVLFLGDIPIPMIRKAQHLTSAFKMNENLDWRESSVPSDRFYDDFHLKFDFIKQDSIDENFFYYELSADSPQEIKCDIYSGRVKPITNGEPDSVQIKRFLNKAIAAHKENNKLDQFYSHTGEGSYSNSLNAWTGEAFNIREQMPGTFDSPVSPGRTRFTRYNFYDYPKDEIIDQITRDDLDLTYFHEHGVPERQYISSTPKTNDNRSHMAQMKYHLRSFARKFQNDSAKMKNFEDTYAEYGIDSTWWSNCNDPEIIRLDSIMDANTGIFPEDVTRFKPNSRMVVFDACYNGDFREPDCIASRYIFADGKTIATFANSVNVLQDKQANELLGLLWMGARVGQWAKETNILESHILGDPTFRFSPSLQEIDGWALCNSTYNEDSIKALLNSEYADVRNFAMHQLWRNNASGLVDSLANIFNTSSKTTERYTALSLLEKIGGETYQHILPKALNDPDEFIRRTTVTRMGKVGLDEYVDFLVDAYFDDNQAERVSFQIENNIPAFSQEVFDKSISRYSGERAEKLKRAQSKQKSVLDEILGRDDNSGRYKKLYMQSLRNNNIHAGLEDLLEILKDPNETETVKLTLLDALAWYDESYRKGEIKEACMLILNSDESEPIKLQAKRTYNRLK